MDPNCSLVAQFRFLQVLCKYLFIYLFLQTIADDYTEVTNNKIYKLLSFCQDK